MNILKNVLLSTLLTLALYAQGMDLGGGTRFIDLPVLLEVRDDGGLPVSNASVRIFFSQSYRVGDSIEVTGLTNSNGVFKARENTRGPVGIRVEKEGHYSWMKGNDFFVYKKTGELRPFDPFECPISVELKKIDNPVPMYIKKVCAEIPLEKTWIGFDLEMGDWCKPHGDGKIPDFLFSATRSVTNKENFSNEIMLSFSNPNDGLMKLEPSQVVRASSMPFPMLAPLGPYKSDWFCQINKINGNRSFVPFEPDDSSVYIFRVRTRTGRKGELLSANYGEIHGDIRLIGSLADQMIITFTYYYNPDGTRNLEYDPKKNLFGEGAGSE